MFYSDNRQDTRKIFFSCWQKAKQKSPLEPLEAMLVEVIGLHPEYHAFLDNPDNVDKDFPVEQGETNPFLHMGMHIAIKEQVSINQPPGIVEVYQQLLNRLQDPHEVEHRMMECLGEMIWQAQRNGVGMDNQVYLDCLKKIGPSPG